MIYSLWFRRYAPFSQFGGGFEGDNRTTASTSMSVTARTVGGVSFGPGYVGPGVTAYSSGTSFQGLGSTVSETLGRHISNVTSSVSVTTSTIALVRFTARTSGSNPMVPLAPDIDTYVDISATFRSSEIVIEGSVRGDNFPNAEVFVYDGVGRSILLWDFTTTGDQTTGPMTRLAGSHESVLLGSFNVKIPILSSGKFVK